MLLSNSVRGILYLAMIATLTLSARGSIIYSFTYTPASGPFPSATYQLVEPGFLVAGTYSIPSSSSFPPFTISDGSVTYDFTQLFVNPFGSNFCFVFGDNQNSFGGCGASLSAGGAPVAMISTEYAGSIPLSLESLAGSAVVDAYPPLASDLEQGIGTVQLDITQTPEPSTAPLVGVSLLASVMLGALGRSRRS